jgi:hypothetical protein
VLLLWAEERLEETALLLAMELLLLSELLLNEEAMLLREELTAEDTLEAEDARDADDADAEEALEALTLRLAQNPGEWMLSLAAMD